MLEEQKIKKGDIYYADLGPIMGCEQNGKRPVVIIQNDIGNKYSPTVIIAPITSKGRRKHDIPTHVPIKLLGKIRHNSIILLEQVRVIDKQRLDNYIGTLQQYQIDEVDKALITSFDIDVIRYLANILNKENSNNVW